MAPREDDAGLRRRITLLTDFGTADGYVAAMRGVIAGRASAIIVEDASHDVPPGDIRAGAFALSNYWLHYPPGTVHLVVIDPGVGTERRPIVVAAAGRFGVGPDNGVLTPMLEADGRAREIREPGLSLEPRSATFHGRDVFAPAAAYLAAGGLPERVGPPVADPVVRPLPRAQRTGSRLAGLVVHTDRFGTLITNVPGSWLEPGAVVEIDGAVIGPVRTTYGDVPSGDVVALIGSGGNLEISVRDGSAAERLGSGCDTPVRVRPAG